MSCDAIRELLSERLDAPLQAEAEVRVSAHLAACAPCCELAALLDDLIEDLAFLGETDRPEGLAERIVAHVPAPGSARRRVRPPWVALVRVAACALLMSGLSLPLLSRAWTGRVVDGVAPVLATARKHVMESRLRGEGLLSGLDARAESGLDGLTGGAPGKEK